MNMNDVKAEVSSVSRPRESVNNLINEIKANIISSQNNLKDILQFLDAGIPEAQKADKQEPRCLIDDLDDMAYTAMGISNQVQMIKEILGI